MAFDTKSWYSANRNDQRAKARVRTAKYRSLNIRLRALILSARPCTDCDEPPDPDTPFEFDHRDGIGARSQNRVSDLITRGTSHVRLLQELALCDVVCPTCHKRRTYAKLEWVRAEALRKL